MKIMRRVSVVTALVLGSLFSSPGEAKQPVSQCTASGQMLARSAANKAGPEGRPTTQSQSSDDMPDALVKSPEPIIAALRPLYRSGINTGSVNPKTGGFTYSNEDIAIGQGEFPARLSLTRTLSTDHASWAPDGISLPSFGPGAPEVRYFGVGSTHNLDIRYITGKQEFTNSTTGQVYSMVYVSFGFSTMSFQKCANGEFMNSTRDGARLFNDSTAVGGMAARYRLELKDGTRIFLMPLGHNSEGVEFCRSSSDYYSDTECGIIGRWEAPNGDWAEFDFETYYDKPDGAINVHLQTDNRIDSYVSPVSFCINTVVQTNDCRDVNAVYSFYHESLSGGLEIRTNRPLYNARVTSIRNSRGLKIVFTYVDSTTQLSSVCPEVFNDGWGPQLYCYPSSSADSQERSLIRAIKTYSGNDFVKQVSYQYGGENAVRYVSGFTDLAGNIWNTEIDGSDGVSWTQLRIYQPGNPTSPISTVNFTPSKAELFQHLPIGIYQSEIRPLAYRMYPRVTSQSFADGRSTQYNATLASKWVTRSYRAYGYAQPITNWQPVEYITRMEIVETGNRLTALQFDDEDAPKAVTDPLGRLTTNTYDDVGKLTMTTLPEGNHTAWQYDVRGNIVLVSQLPKTGGSAALTKQFSFVGGPLLPANGCANQKTCNQPSSSVDEAGNTSSYTWDTASGLLSSATGPADQLGVHPLTTFGYSDFSGAGGSVRLLTSKSEKINASQNATTAFSYDAGSPLWLRGVAVTADGQTRRTCYGYDVQGNRIWETKPRAGLAVCY